MLCPAQSRDLLQRARHVAPTVECVEDPASLRGGCQGVRLAPACVRRRIPRPPARQPGLGPLELVLRLAPHGLLLDEVEEGLALVHLVEALAQGDGNHQEEECHSIHASVDDRLLAAEAEGYRPVDQNAAQCQRRHGEPANGHGQVHCGDDAVHVQDRVGVALVRVQRQDLSKVAPKQLARTGWCAQDCADHADEREDNDQALHQCRSKLATQRTLTGESQEEAEDKHQQMKGSRNQQDLAIVGGTAWRVRCHQEKRGGECGQG
mmetsp:Transcript_107585/g.336956  ORF Transcript_107585/g.336956 Transcript_107585/m.336956 type:complete len:264 (-) Transcript_107585:272-1063(-)